MPWCNELERWYRSPGSTRKLGIVKQRDNDEDVMIGFEFMGRWVDIHATGRFVDIEDVIARSSKQPTNYNPTDKPR